MRNVTLAFNYNFRCLFRRKVTSLLTLGGIALVVAVYTTSLMLSAGLEKTLAGTGSDNNVIVLRNGAQNEIQSSVSRDHARIILSHPDVARLPGNIPFASTDVVVLASLRKKAGNAESNVGLRGISSAGAKLRGDVAIVEGRYFNPGTQEVIVGTAVNRRFKGTAPGEKLRLAGTEWIVTGIFDAKDTSFSSEIWGDVDIMMPLFKRELFSSVLFRLREGADFESLQSGLQDDRRLSVAAKNEREFYQSQSEILAKFIRFLGTFVSVVFSLAAVIACVITMYSAVSQRLREIGILRAIGFGRDMILFSFVIECLLLALTGGLLGLLLSSLLAGQAFSTTNFQTFSDLTFHFTLTPVIALKGLLFALIIGAVGAILPAWKASRITIVEAVRED